MRVAVQDEVLPLTHIFVANGDLDCPERLQELCAHGEYHIAAADGGMNHCAHLNIPVERLVGDLDSVDKNILQELDASRVEVIAMDRAKDKTDLRALIDSYSIDQISRAVIFGGLGGRVDHSLGNLYLLTRYPSKLALETEEESIVALCDQGPITFYPGDRKYLSFVPFYKPSEFFTLTQGGKSQEIPISSDFTPYRIEIEEETTLSLSKGFALCILSDTSEPSKWAIQNLMPALFKASREGTAIDHPSGQIEFLGSQQSITLEPEPGQTISLIPLFAAATGLLTEGLKWNLSGECTTLHNRFISTCNIVQAPPATISVGSGELMVYMPDFIDTEMLMLKDLSSTAHLTL